MLGAKYTAAEAAANVNEFYAGIPKWAKTDEEKRKAREEMRRRILNEDGSPKRDAEQFDSIDAATKSMLKEDYTTIYSLFSKEADGGYAVVYWADAGRYVQAGWSCLLHCPDKEEIYEFMEKRIDELEEK